MRDPHILSLRYKLETISTVTFNNPPPVTIETDTFLLRLENEKAFVEMKRHFATVEAAKSAIDPFLRAWELDMALDFGRQEIKFTYEDAEVIDRNPPPPGAPQLLQLSGIALATSVAAGTLSVARREYRLPPKHFKVNPDVDTLWHRFDGYNQGREPLLAMAYSCLTLLEARAGGRKNAEKVYRIHKAVFDKLGELTANRGDERTARKLKKASALVPLTPTETRWIEAVTKAIIRRVGEIDANPSLDVLTMSELPAL